MITFCVPGMPVGKGRPKASRTPTGIRMRTPEKTAHYENLVAMSAHAAMIKASITEPLAGPVELTLVMDYKIPASWSKRAQERAQRGETHPTTKPDLDNVLKAIGDACNGIVWRDDAQIVVMLGAKAYGPEPKTTIRVIEARFP